MKFVFIFFTVVAIVSAAPISIPFDVSKVDVDKISKADMLKTIEHRNQLHLELQSKFDEQQVHIVNQDKVLLKTSEALADSTKAVLVLKDEVQKQTNKLNATQDKLYKAAKALWWYRLHWWGAWVMLGLGVVACVIFAGARIAAKFAK